ncbi:MAG: xanthine dehydrogenase accessory protein XdhC [Pseudomonadota bacterium]
MTLASFFSANDPVVAVRVARVEGSAPREEAATMFVARDALHGTIGGGQLEYMAIDEARKLIARRGSGTEMILPLGPEIGQCCGGRVTLALSLMTEADRCAAIAAADRREAEAPRVLIFGAGHTGRALSAALSLLPVNALLIDARAEELALAPPDAPARLTAVPEAEVRAAPPGAAYVILTHDHALDFLIAAEALARGDAVYVGMIGSATKRAAFANWMRREEIGAASALTCPIGAGGAGDKRPEVIAAHVAAEIMAAFSTCECIGHVNASASEVR